jgi:hypothetical protein
MVPGADGEVFPALNDLAKALVSGHLPLDGNLRREGLCRLICKETAPQGKAGWVGLAARNTQTKHVYPDGLV